MKATYRAQSWLLVGLVILSIIWPEAALLSAPLVMGVTMDTEGLNELMKIAFDDVFIQSVVTDTELLDHIPDGEVRRGSEGRWFETSNLYQLPGSWGSRSENGYIPVSNSAKAENGRINLKKIMGTLEETDEVLKKIKGDRVAFANWAEEQFPQFRMGLSDEYDRQLLGTGSGIRARVAAIDAGPPVAIEVEDTLGVDGFDQMLMQFRRGMFLRASANADGSTPRTGVMEVADTDWDSDELILAGASADALAPGDYLFEGDAADNSAGKDMMGLLGMIDDGNIVEVLQFIDRSDHRWFRSYVHDVQAVHGAGTMLSETVLIQADRNARFRGGGKVDLIVLSEEGFDQVWGDLKADRTINDPRAYTGGRSTITVLFGGTRSLDLLTARKMPSKLAFGIQKDQLRKFILHEFEWDDLTGSIWNLVTDAVGRKHAYFAFGAAYGEIGIKDPQRCWRVENWGDGAGESV